jgi:molybdenum ABC transporter molybdate-binding protein
MRLKFPVVAIVSLAAIAGLVFLLRDHSSTQDADKQTITLLYAAGLRAPVEAVIKEYEGEFPNTRVDVLPSGSGQLLANVLSGHAGDLFLAADSSYLDKAAEKGAVVERIPIGAQMPVISFRKDAKKQIATLKELDDPALRIGLGVPDGPAIGTVSKKSLEKAGIWTQVDAVVRARGVYKPTVQGLANDLKLGTIDVAILFDGTANQYPELRSVPIAPELNIPQHIEIGVLKTATDPSRALHFARYLTARDRGLKQFHDFAYGTVEGDAWADVPDLHLMSGGLLRPAIIKTLDEFERREGVKIQRKFNGCGILVSSLKAGGPENAADAYFACDVSFLRPVADMFLNPAEMSQANMVIAVAKGNPLGIKQLADLAKPGLKVGVCNAKQSTLGALTEDVLKRANVYDTVMKNVKVQTPTADGLITAFQGPKSDQSTLDAAVVYDVNALLAPKYIEMLPIAERTTPAIQPFAVSRNSNHKYLTQRLYEALRRDVSQKRFEDLGFVWRKPQADVLQGPTQ